MATGLQLDTPIATKLGIILHVEARLLPTANTTDRDKIIEIIVKWLYESFDSLSVGQELISFGKL